MSHRFRTPRNVYGQDIVVSYLVSRDRILITRVLPCQVRQRRISSTNILPILGLKPNLEAIHFLKNNNLHKSHNGLRGVLLLVNYRIGLIISNQGTSILFQALLPKNDFGKISLIDLDHRNGHYGFFLQQIHGPLLSNPTPQCLKICKPYPYLIGDGLFMDPAGPHVFVPPPMSAVPQGLLTEFKNTKDNLTYEANITNRCSRYHKQRRKSKMGDVLYVTDSNARLDMADQRDSFFVPLGSPYGRVQCPWRSNVVNATE